MLDEGEEHGGDVGLPGDLVVLLEHLEAQVALLGVAFVELVFRFERDAVD